MHSPLKVIFFISCAVQSLCAMELFDATQEIQQTINPALLHTFWMFNEQEILPPLEPEVEPAVAPALEVPQRPRRERKPTVLYNDFIADKLEKDSIHESDDDYVLVLDNYHSKKGTRTDKVRSFTCNECTKSYDTQYYLNRHKKFAHNLERPFSCDQCPQSFKQKHHWVEHVRRHGSDVYFCKVCLKGLKRNSELTRHLKDVHDIRK